MKKYILAAGNGVSDLLLSDFTDKKEFNDFDAANFAFAKEVEKMNKIYTPESKLNYPIEEVNAAETIQIWVDLVCDDYPPETILISDHFLM